MLVQPKRKLYHQLFWLFLQLEPVFTALAVSEHGYYMDPKASEAVTRLKEVTPTTVGEVRRVLGLLGVYRRHNL